MLDYSGLRNWFSKEMEMLSLLQLHLNGPNRIYHFFFIWMWRRWPVSTFFWCRQKLAHRQYSHDRHSDKWEDTHCFILWINSENMAKNSSAKLSLSEIMYLSAILRVYNLSLSSASTVVCISTLQHVSALSGHRQVTQLCIRLFALLLFLPTLANTNGRGRGCILLLLKHAAIHIRRTYTHYCVDWT
jgi:hypothetical protein